MIPQEISDYIQKRYERWLDYAKFHCSIAGMADEAIDVLNEVLLSLLKKDGSALLKLLHKKKGSYCELDWYILRMIKLNATSDTSPYRHRYKKTVVPIDRNIDYSQMEIIDEECEEHDRPGEILKKTRIIRDVVETLPIPDYDKSVFMFRMSGEAWVDWQGEGKQKKLFDVFYKVKKLVKEEIQSGRKKNQLAWAE